MIEADLRGTNNFDSLKYCEKNLFSFYSLDVVDTDSRNNVKY